MKTLLTLCGLLLSLAVFSAETYVPPKQLTPDEAKQSETALINNKIILWNRWNSRLALAKLNNNKLAKKGTPLQKPYYGDSAVHQH